MNKAKSVVEYYVLTNKLKDVVRTGWLNWEVSRERVESIAEHVYGTQQLALAMWSQYEYDIDIKKVLFMLSIHELEETIIGDLTLWDIKEEDKMKKGHEAIKMALKDLVSKEEIESLILEFDERKTKEAKFAFHIDKIECDIQCKLYDEENCVNFYKEKNNKMIKDERVQKLSAEDKSWSQMWLDFDKYRYDDDSNFMELWEYIRNNKIK